MASRRIEVVGGRYIVNVSAMEGKFYRFKTADHPHTNMAKAGLPLVIEFRFRVEVSDH